MENAIVEQKFDVKEQVKDLLDNREYFIENILPILKNKQDYHVILNKKCLAKGGAEKLATIFGLVATFEVDKDTMEALGQVDKGVVAYVCNLNKGDQLMGQGRGSDNTKANRGDSNKTIKMAQKRAFVDAVIRATGLSDIFTQDLDDMYPPKQEKAVTAQNTKPDVVLAQKTKIKEKCDTLNPDLETADDYKAFVLESTGDTLVEKNFATIIRKLNELIKVEEAVVESERVMAEVNEKSKARELMEKGRAEAKGGAGI